MGDVAGTNRFENLAVSVQHDLDVVKLAHRKGSRVPKFRFEQKSFNIVKCNTDLAETELEIQVVRGISYNVSRPKDVDTYVKVELPYPQVQWTNRRPILTFITFDFFFLVRTRKRLIEIKLQSFMTPIVQNTMKNFWPKFNQKHDYVNGSSSAMASNLKSISKGRCNLFPTFSNVYTYCILYQIP